ncbi:MAG: hypothetical protein AB1374_12010 [Bacillota bacterium]
MVSEQGCLLRGESRRIDDFTEKLKKFLSHYSGCFYAQHIFKDGEQGVYIAAALPKDFGMDGWEQGRVFNDGFELRWQRSGELVRLLLLFERQEESLPDFCTWEERFGFHFKAGIYIYEVEPTRHLLVGSYYPGRNFFAEAGIPRKFIYPGLTAGLRQGTRAVLEGKNYRRRGRVVLTRFTHFAVDTVESE